MRKSSYSYAAHVVKHLRKALRRFTGLQQRSFDFCHELAAESGFLSFIPTGCFVVLKTSGSSEKRPQGHFPRRERVEALTCSHDVTSSG